MEPMPFGRALPLILALAPGLATACGGRSELFVSSPVADAAPPIADAAVDARSQAQSGMFCLTDADCMTTLYCVESARCDSVAGCVFSARSCDDGVACTRDACSETTRSCGHTPDDSLCPTSQLCSVGRGCGAFVYAVASDGHLYETDVPSGTLVDLGASAAPLLDIALDNGVLYATDSYILYRVDRGTAVATTIGSILPLHSYAGLGTGPGGTLLATADVPSLFQVDPSSAAATLLSTLPAGFSEGGDVSAFGGGTYVTASSPLAPTSDSLLSLDATTKQWSVVAALGRRCAWGLATLGDALYALTCDGYVLSADPTSGVVTLVAQSTAQFVGAAGR